MLIKPNAGMNFTFLFWMNSQIPQARGKLSAATNDHVAPNWSSPLSFFRIKVGNRIQIPISINTLLSDCFLGGVFFSSTDFCSELIFGLSDINEC